MEEEFVKFLKSKRIYKRFLDNQYNSNWEPSWQSLMKQEPRNYISLAFNYKDDSNIDWPYLSELWRDRVSEIEKQTKPLNGDNFSHFERVWN